MNLHRIEQELDYRDLLSEQAVHELVQTINRDVASNRGDGAESRRRNEAIERKLRYVSIDELSHRPA